MIAYYDNEPATFAEVGNGSILYHYAIERIETEEGTQWKCEEVTVWKPVTKNAVTAAVIADAWASDYEQKLVNEYNAALIGLTEGDAADKARKKYIAFLNARQTLKEQIENDCDKNGIL